MKIRITIEAINDDDEVINKESGEIDASNNAGDIRQWVMETYTKVKVNAILASNLI